MIKKWQDDAWADYIYWQTQDKKTLRKINKLIQDIVINKNWILHQWFHRCSTQFF